VAGALAPHLEAIRAQDYPRFAAAEMARRREALAEEMTRAGADVVLVCGEQRAGGAVGWLTGWPVTAEAVAVFQPPQPELLFVQYYNHVPLARRIAACETRWAGHSTVATVIEELDRRRARRVGIIGPLALGKYRALAAHYELLDLNPAYVQLRLVKSAAELDWVRIGAWLSDQAIDALTAQLRSGVDERELWRMAENAYVGLGGATWIHYFGVTPMADPWICVPAQYPSRRRVASGDVVFTEISAQFWDYPGQVLRSFTVEADPTPLYRDLHAVAEAACESILAVVRDGAAMAEIVEAAGMIEAAGFTTCDDLVHGFVGGYLPPVLGSRSRPAGPLPALRLVAGMTIVVQPNVVTPDGRAGVQTGELVLVTGSGFERLHAAPRGFARVG